LTRKIEAALGLHGRCFVLSHSQEYLTQIGVQCCFCANECAVESFKATGQNVDSISLAQPRQGITSPSGKVHVIEHEERDLFGIGLTGQQPRRVIECVKALRALTIGGQRLPVRAGKPGAEQPRGGIVRDRPRVCRKFYSG